MDYHEDTKSTKEGVVQVTHQEDGIPELWIHTTSYVDGRLQIQFWPEEEFDESIASYEKQGWHKTGEVENRTFREGDDSIWLRF